tara:strand:+ start:114 stop:488 length:375 start_codon:yes stop_codon:yes gene_type:complete
MRTYTEILSDKRTFKESFIIYALIRNNEIVYIGQSKKILSRIGQHLQGEKEFDSWSIVENLGEYGTAGELNRLEKKYIRKFMPVYNINYNKLNKKIFKIKVKKRYENSQVGIVLKGKAADGYRR